MKWTTTIGCAALVAAACSSQGAATSGAGGATGAGTVAGGSAAVAIAPPDAAPPPPDASALVLAADGVARGPLPAALDPRVAALLAEPVPDRVVVRFAEIARGDDPSANIRWDLDRDGRLFFVRHSDKGDARAAFDRPLPDKPSLKLDVKHVNEIYGALAAQRFYDHPGFETVPGAVGGTAVIVRARPKNGGELHTVVYDVSRPDLLDFLEVVTVAL